MSSTRRETHTAKLNICVVEKDTETITISSPLFAQGDIVCIFWLNLKYKPKVASSSLQRGLLWLLLLEGETHSYWPHDCWNLHSALFGDFFFLLPINPQLRATGYNFMTRNISWVFLMLQSQQYRLICSSLVNTFLNMHPATPHCNILLGNITRAEYQILVMGFFVGFFPVPLAWKC